MNLNKYYKCSCKEQNKKCPINIDLKKEYKIIQESKNLFQKFYKFDLTSLNSIQEYFALVASTFSQNCEHAQRMYDYISNTHFMPSTTVLRYVSGLDALPIACFTNTFHEVHGNAFLDVMNTIYSQLSVGGGSSMGISKVKEVTADGNSYLLNSGIMSYIRAIEAICDMLKTYTTRGASSAFYVSVDHPEIEDFVSLRKPTFDLNKIRLSSKTNIAVCISDEFMKKVESNGSWDLISRYDNSVVKTISAVSLWIKILTARMETGEPYIFFIDNVARNLPEVYKKLGMNIEVSNICTEIILPVGLDHLGNRRTGVCCLGSLNVELFDEWKNNDLIIEDCLLFLDNVLSKFIEEADSTLSLKASVYSAIRSRAVGIGAMGFHFALQAKKIPFESPEAKDFNEEVFSHINKKAIEASTILGRELGPNKDCEEVNICERFSSKIAIAPTTYISTACNFTSLGINPVYSNCYMHKSSIGNIYMKNRILDKHIKDNYAAEYDEIWANIIQNMGSVSQVVQFSEEEKNVFKVSFEINQESHVALCAQRQKYLCQSQSVNLFFTNEVSKKAINEVHMKAWKEGLSTLYYIHSSPAIHTTNKGLTIDNNNKCENCET